jgi:hypothetical protein
MSQLMGKAERKRLRESHKGCRNETCKSIIALLDHIDALERQVEAHCHDLEKCVPALRANRLMATAAEFELAVKELRAAIASAQEVKTNA